MDSCERREFLRQLGSLLDAPTLDFAADVLATLDQATGELGSRFTPEQRVEFLRHLQGGMTLGAAAYVLQIPRHVVEGYIAEHADFALDVRDAEATCDEHVQEAVYQAAVSGNVTAAKLWFEIRRQSARPPRVDVRLGGRDLGSFEPTPPPPAPGPADSDLTAAMDEMGLP